MPRKSHGWRSLVGCSPWGRYKSGAAERLHFHFSLSHNGEGNGSPLQCSCLENPRDGRAWWAAVYGVAQSRTRLKRLSSSSSSSLQNYEKINLSSLGHSVHGIPLHGHISLTISPVERHLSCFLFSVVENISYLIYNMKVWVGLVSSNFSFGP